MMEWPVNPLQSTGNGNSINPFLLKQHVFSIPKNDAGAQAAPTEPNGTAQDTELPIFSGINVDSSTTVKSPCNRQSATSYSGQTQVVPLEASTYYPPPSTLFTPDLRYSMDVRAMEDVVAHQPNIAWNTSEAHLSESAPSLPLFGVNGKTVPAPGTFLVLATSSATSSQSISPRMPIHAERRTVEKPLDGQTTCKSIPGAVTKFVKP